MKKMTIILLSAAVSGMFAGCSGLEEPEEQNMPEEDAVDVLSDTSNNAEQIAEAEMQDTEGTVIGSVQFYEKDSAVMMQALFDEGISKGFHGFHIHETGLCEADAEDGPFTTAGGHFNPENVNHGSHAGDMPSLYGMENGSSYLVTALDQIQPRDLVNENLAVIVHSDPDNFANIPDRYVSSESNEPGPDEETLQAGDAGSRISCGVVAAVN